MIIVLCHEKSNRSDRWTFNNEIQREYGLYRTHPEILNKLNGFKFMPSTKTETKLPIVACFDGHLNIIKRIIKEDLKNVLICEDDADIDFQRFNEFLKVDKPDGLIYLGGRFDFPKIKDWKLGREAIENYMSKNYSHIQGFNKVKDDFIITGSHGYFIKNKEVAEKMLNDLKGKSGKYKSNLIDVCISKIKMDKFYYYPTIVNIKPLDSSIGHKNEESTCNNYETKI
jgi:GR25 family glycosyltransferase involved in LPS biosynthesis